MQLSPSTVTTTCSTNAVIVYTTSSTGYPPDDQGLAGVREPRRPLPVLPSGAAEAPIPIPDLPRNPGYCCA